MSLLGNVLHSIGHLIDGNDDDQKKKRQQNQPQKVVVAPKPAPQAPTVPYAPLNLDTLTTSPNQTPANQLIKVKAPAAVAPNPAVTNQPKRSLLQKAVHIISTGAKDTGSVAAGTSLGVLRAGEGLVSGALDIPSLATHALTYAPRKIAGDNSTISKDLGAVNRFTDKVVKTEQTPIDKLAKVTDQAAMAYGQPGADVYKPVQVAANLLTLVPAASAIVGKVGEVGNLGKVSDAANALNKVVDSQKAASPIYSKAADLGLVKAAPRGDVADGVTSVNPTKEADAAEQIAQQTPPPPPELAPVEPHVMSQPEADELALLNKATKTKVLTKDETTVRDTLQAKADNIAAANAPPEPPVPVEETPPAPVATPVKPAPTAQPIKTGGPKQVPQGTVTPNAPEIRAQLEKDLGTTAKKVDLKNPDQAHEALSNEEINAAADRVTATMSDEELVNTYKTGAKFTETSDIAKGLSAAKRLGKLKKAGNADAGIAIDNIIDGAAAVTSKGGRTLNYAQSIYDSLPKEAKVSYLIRQIDKKTADVKGFDPIARDPALKKEVEGKIDGFLSNDEAIKEKAAELEGLIQKANDDPTHSSLDPKQLNNLKKQLDNLKLQGEANEGDLLTYYDTLVPKAAAGERAGDLGRTLMLSSISGRINDPITTSLNLLHSLTTMTVESLAGKVGNAGRAVLGKEPGKYVSKLPSLRVLAKGSVVPLKKSLGEFKGQVYSGEDLQKAIRSTNQGSKTQLNRAATGRTLPGRGLVRAKKIIRAGAEFATNASAGIKDVQLQRLAHQEGLQRGLKGDALKTFTAGRTALPSRTAEANAVRFHEEVNNLNDNPFSHYLGKVADSITKLGDGDATGKAKILNAVGEQVRNMILPFTRWAGGQAWNGLTDKNAVANIIKAGNSLVRGDAQGFVTNMSKLGVNTAATMTLGYALAKSGMISYKNPEGYNDDGLDIHIGGRYIPAGLFGFFAPGMIMGASTYHALNDANNKDKSVVAKVSKITGDTFDAGWKAYSVNQLIGQDNPVVQTAVLSKQKDSNVTNRDTAMTAFGQAIGQYIPAVTGDINAVLNNGFKIAGKGFNAFHNPNHEAPLTKVTKTNPATGNQVKDYTKTVIQQLENKIPFVSQHLPRKAGVAAPDLVDRTTRGTRDTGTSVQEQKDAQSLSDQQADFAKRGIPDPTAKYKDGDSFDQAVENRVENKNYSQAIEGLQKQLDIAKKQPDTTTKKTDPIQDKIKQLQILQSGDYDPSIRDTYKNTDLSEWRDLGDPDSDSYDPKKYQLLFQYDSQLTDKGISGKDGDKTSPKYSAKTSKSKSGSGSGNKAVTSNTLGSVPKYGRVDLSSLSPQKIADAKIPTIQQIKPGELIKKRQISVSKG